MVGRGNLQYTGTIYLKEKGNRFIRLFTVHKSRNASVFLLVVTTGFLQLSGFVHFSPLKTVFPVDYLKNLHAHMRRDRPKTAKQLLGDSLG